jgi:hypothetical protein
LAITGLLNSICPMPSEPASIPTVRNNSRAGTPRRPEALLAKTLANNKTAIIIGSDLIVVVF